MTGRLVSGDDKVSVQRPVGRPPALSSSVSARISRLRRRDTAPEVALRRALFAAGFRHRVALAVPGLARRSVDIALTRRRIALCVDGCFWHGCPSHGSAPKNNSEWWRAKLQGNARRDAETSGWLESLGWTVLRVWEHEAPDAVVATVERWNGGTVERLYAISASIRDDSNPGLRPGGQDRVGVSHGA